MTQTEMESVINEVVAATMKVDRVNQKYRNEYAAKATEYAKAGLTEDDYVDSRRLDDGLDVLTFADTGVEVAAPRQRQDVPEHRFGVGSEEFLR